MPYGGNDKAACRGLVPPSTLKKFKCWEDSLCRVSRYTICKWGQILARFWHFCFTIREGERKRHAKRERRGHSGNACSKVWNFVYLKRHRQSIPEEEGTCSIIWPVKAHNHFWELFCRWRTLQWVRWISEDYANAERRNSESCSQSAETNPCAKRHHKTFLAFSLLLNKVLQEITEQKENGLEVKSTWNVKCSILLVPINL